MITFLTSRPRIQYRETTEGFTPRCTSTVYSIAFSPDGKLLASAAQRFSEGVGTAVRLWTLDGDLYGTVFASFLGTATSVAFSPDGTLLAFSLFGEIRLRKMPSAREPELAKLKGDAPIAFSPDGKLLASGSGGGAIKLWEVPDAREIAVLAGHSKKVTSIAFSPAASLLASGSLDKTIRLWGLD